MQQKVDASENFCYKEHQFYLEMKDGYKVSCVKILIFYLITRSLVFI